MQRIIVTGASGFVGRHVLAALGDAALPLSLRSGDPIADRLAAIMDVGPVGGIIHLGARAHRADAAAASALVPYRRDNRDLSVALGEAALAAGIPRLVFCSTIGVLGARSPGRPFRADDPPHPATVYARSKAEAERALLAMADRGLEPVIVRPPLVCGADAPGNLARLARAVIRGVPLPVGAVRNRRSLINAKDLADLLALAVRHPGAAGGVFLAGDRHPMSTLDLVRHLARAAGVSPRLVAIPVPVLRLAGTLTGRGRMIGQLVDDCEVDAGPTGRRLDWYPVHGLDEGLRALADSLRTRDRR